MRNDAKQGIKENKATDRPRGSAASRWPIEEVHLVLKSGCQVEDLRLETWEGLEKAVTVNAAVAARIVSLRDLARETQEAPAAQVLTSDEVEVLVGHFGNGMKPTGYQLNIQAVPPSKPA